MRSVIGLLEVLVGLVALAAPAQATFPGRNGGIAFGLRTSDGDHVPVTDHARLEFLRQPLAKDRTRSLIDWVGSSVQAKEVAPTQVSGESGSVVSFDPAWRPR